MAGVVDSGTRSSSTTGTVAGSQTEETNWILRQLDRREYAVLERHVERVTLKTLDVLAEMGASLTHAYFPQNAIISVVRPADGTLVEAGTIGREGMAGISALLGATWTQSKLLCQVPGTCTRIPFQSLVDLLPELPDLRAKLGRFTLAFMDQVGQTAACNVRHSVDQRCARWLLLTRDRIDGDTLPLTHEVLAQMLGVRRAGVTEAAGEMQRAGAIRYGRGRITVIDPDKLRALACECYGINRAHIIRLLGENDMPS
jgi:CRP-like cAMP-binding protein